MNNSVAKYAPKIRTNSTNMDLSNRVMIAIGTSNLGYLTFWERVFADLDLVFMNTDTKSFLIVMNHHRTYRKMYKEN